MQRILNKFKKKIIKGLKVYKVGGIVRDTILGLPVEDSDWVVVGSDPMDMEKRGFIPVGKDFPVFLHPINKEEYALARTERKSGKGYKGFDFQTNKNVTLVEDLMRRDLTINAIASSESGELIDPYHGLDDIRKKLLRHVSPAFQEDPVRILRLARFSGKFHDFSVVDETLELCKMMVQRGDINDLMPERIWKEISRGLFSKKPSKMFQFLEKIGALSRILPELKLPNFLRNCLDQLPEESDLPMRYALFCLSSPLRERLHVRLHVPTICSEYANLFAIIANKSNRLLSSEDHLSFIEESDAIRRPVRFISLLKILSILKQENLNVSVWKDRINSIRKIDLFKYNLIGRNPIEIKSEIRKIRLKILEKE